MIFGDAEKEHFVALMRKFEGFLGFRVVTCVAMCNHFHLLVEEPDEAARVGLARETLLKRMQSDSPAKSGDLIQLDRSDCQIVRGLEIHPEAARGAKRLT